jgi:hypothetical protein
MDLEDAQLFVLKMNGLLSYHTDTKENLTDVGYRVRVFPSEEFASLGGFVVGYWEDMNEAVRYAMDIVFDDDIRTPVVYYGPQTAGKDWK